MTTVFHSELLDGALGLAARGIPVIPLRPRSKAPKWPKWPGLGMVNPDAVRTVWGQDPDSNVGVLCGPDALDGRGLIILDVDLPDGPDALAMFEEAHGKLPPTLSVNTPSGGAHHYFEGHSVSWNPARGLEVRAAGRQCAAPPSVHPNGGRYAWAEGVNIIAQGPAWLSAPAIGDPRPAPALSDPRLVSFSRPGRQRAARSRREAARASHPNGLRDPVLEVPPAAYFKELCGLVPDRNGFVHCPVHPFEDLEPSCKVYGTAERGWFCFGEECRQGGDVVTLAALLADIPLPLRGYRFIAALEYLRGRLLP